MSGLAWQKNSADDLSGTWSDISSLVLNDGEEITLAIEESEGRDRVARLYAACHDNMSPSDAVNRHGKEMATEGWLEVSLHGLATWQALTFPTSFPALFDDLSASEGAFQFSISASGLTLLDFRMVVPAGASSAGNILWQPILRCRDA